MQEEENRVTMKRIESVQSLYVNLQEPHIMQNVQINKLKSNIHYSIKDRQLYLQQIPTSGKIKLFNLLGQCIWQKHIQAGTQIIPMHIDSGVYILQIQTKNSIKRDKIRF
jgi:hypothetical protein